MTQNSSSVSACWVRLGVEAFLKDRSCQCHFGGVPAFTYYDLLNYCLLGYLLAVGGYKKTLAIPHQAESLGPFYYSLEYPKASIKPVSYASKMGLKGVQNALWGHTSGSSVC